MASTTSPRFLLSDQRTPAPWRNGGGSTSQVAIHPAGATTENFDWRISIATVDHESQFSLFPGVNRWLMPLSPEGMTLRVEGETTRLAGRVAFAFGGEASVRSINVTKTALDLNLMVRLGYARGSLLALIVHGDTKITAAANEIVVIVVIEGAPSVDEITLQELDAIELESGTDLVLDGEAVIAIARITRA
jgi:uncharacterized protein